MLFKERRCTMDHPYNRCDHRDQALATVTRGADKTGAIPCPREAMSRDLAPVRGSAGRPKSPSGQDRSAEGHRRARTCPPGRTGYCRPCRASGGWGYGETKRVNPMRQWLKDARRCGARTRQRRPCQGMAMANGRCRMHGGGSPGAPKGNRNAWKHGYYSGESADMRRALRALLSSAKGSQSAPIMSLRSGLRGASPRAGDSASLIRLGVTK